MTTIADSSAFKNSDRVLPQHQAALTLLQGRLSAPDIERLAWLDLACGRGQIIVALDRNLSPQARAKVKYWAYDLNQEFARETRKTADRLGFESFEILVGDLSDFDKILPIGVQFDFITLTNTIHEIEPARLATLLVNCLGRLTQSGSLFIYDMEKIKPPELGAVPWTRDDIRQILLRMLDSLGASSYRPEVGLWNHSSCNGWNVQLERQHLNISGDVVTARIGDAVRETGDEIVKLLRKRLETCRASLESLTMCGAETAAEQEDKERLLFEFWSVSRSLGRST
ncbi:class I SAM-dependent methyltransferase [Rhodopseudomonas palustris]|nr:class I SAM-dependent methyltransferase [Rhodopseudomonas palustris]